jgi:uncharacterized tellurite resistance protein B-like protein
MAKGSDYRRARRSIHANSAIGDRLGHGVSSDEENPMELADLNKDEQLALAGLLEFVVQASGHVTPDEETEIDAIVEAIGEENYRAAVDEVDKRFPDEQALRSFLAKIERQEAREVIYGTVIEAAMTDTVEGRENQLLPWLATQWKVEVTYEQPPADAEGK